MSQRIRSLLPSILPLATLAAVVLLVYRKFVFSNLILARGDTYLYFYPYWQAASDALKAGRIPLWNPDLFMGAPLLANSQVGFFYPLNWPVWLLLETPYAVSATIVLHIFIAACGMYVVGRRGLQLSRGGAVLAALLYAMGGYLSAQVEHVNQVQGLAWTPWLLAVATQWEAVLDNRRLVLRRAAAIGLLFGLQLLAGHTQTTFISGIGIGVWTGMQLLMLSAEKHTWPKRFGLGLLFALAALIIGVVIAVMLAGAQLLPTFELTQLSRRQGGLPIGEALSFSLHPLLFARALLPTYGQIPFSEYIAYLPVTGLVLSIVGACTLPKNRRVLAPITLCLLGLFFAFGEYNPIFKNYIIYLPGFSLFRVPARWLVLYGFGSALLAGAGWDAIEQHWTNWRVRQDRGDAGIRLGGLHGSVAVAIALVLGLMVLVPFSAELGLTRIPMPPESPAEVPRFTLWLGWLVELSLLVIVLGWLMARSTQARWLLWVPLVAGLVWAQRSLLDGALTTPEAYFDVRPAVARLMVSAEEARQANQPSPRFLSISKGYFDPGDQGELTSIYADQLTTEAQYRLTLTAKDREIVVPNLTLSFGLSAIDGFDGGLLPLGDYAETVGLMLPDGVETVDGRLREFLTIIPEPQWLDLFGVKHLITDRIGDNFYQSGPDNVFFDLQQRELIAAGQTLEVGFLPPYQSTELWIIAEGEAGNVIITSGNDEFVVQSEIIPGTVSGESTEARVENIYRASWPEGVQPDAIRLQATTSDWLVAGVSLVNSTTNSSRQIVPGNYRQAHKGDVKIYENLDVMPRAFAVFGWQHAPDLAASVAAMQTVDLRQTAIVQGDGQGQATDAQGMVSAEITSFTPERITLLVDMPSDGLLVLTEAYYPGWEATANGEPVEIEKVNGMFRGMFLSAGQHDVVLEFRPSSLRNGLLVTAAGVVVLAACAAIGLRHTTKTTES